MAELMLLTQSAYSTFWTAFNGNSVPYTSQIFSYLAQFNHTTEIWIQKNSFLADWGDDREPDCYGYDRQTTANPM